MYATAGTGTTPAGAQIWGQYSPGVPESPSQFEFFGSVIGAGEFRATAADPVVGVWQRRWSRRSGMKEG